jgi:hypothetical protein
MLLWFVNVALRNEDEYHHHFNIAVCGQEKKAEKYQNSLDGIFFLI